jgi:ribonuclease HII
MRYVIGVDEAGRGPLAGPVVVGVVMAPEALLPKLQRMFPGVNDSKQLSEAERERIYARMRAEREAGERAGFAGALPPFRFCVRLASAQSIDARGIVPSIYGCVARGIRALAPLDTAASPQRAGASYRILLDGSLRAPAGYEQETVIRGDAIHPIISLASIAAKVERDRLMARLAARHPEYGFERHKGYGTAFHYEMLEKHGPCVVHRRSFLPLEMGGGKA